MASIIPCIFKEKLRSDSHFMLKYSDLEFCFAGRVDKRIYLEVHSRAKQSHWQSERERVDPEGSYWLAKLSYNPRGAYGNRRERWMPWKDERSPIVVRCDAYALTNSVAAQATITRRALREVVCGQVDRLVPDGLFDRQWQIKAWLHARERLLEGITLEWKDSRVSLVARHRVDLNQKQPRVV